MAYAELFCQSNYSFLTGASHAEELMIQADFLRYQALAITDECSVAGVVRAYTAIREHNLAIELIVGSVFTLSDTCRLVLLCPNRAAYAELCRVISNARRRSEKGHYELSEWDILSLKQCFIIWLPQHTEHDDTWAHWLSHTHRERLWIGIQRHLTAGEFRYVEHCQQLAASHQLPITACGGVMMHNATRLPLHHVLTAIKLGKPIANIQAHLLTNTERALRSQSKLATLFEPEWRAESVRIAKRCQFRLDSLRYEYPKELVPDGTTAMNHLHALVEQGKHWRFPDGVPHDIADTIEKELRLIADMDYAFYFLTIHDIVQFAKQQGILYQGRGSAANSVVCYCLAITSVDPRQISVLFERFISKERNEPPDIDVDFEHERREEVIQYIYKKYGRQRAALAATVISYRFKSAVRDVGKALGIDSAQLDYFIQNVNRRDHQQDWQNQIVELGLEPDSIVGQQFITFIDEILGFPRHLSQHVGGFVISAGPLYELVPTENATMADRTIIQWDKNDIESLGLLKVDVLALGMLTAIRKCFDIIHQHTGTRLSIADITRLQDDPKVYAMIQQADTIGVFQIESRAQMSMLPRLKPRCYYDLVVQIAIVRPGPIQGDMVHPYLKRRDGVEAIRYPSEEVRGVLERTMGVPIFQEQVIKLAMVAAGFTGGEADQLRRAMASWKKTGQLAKFKDKLITGMQARGYRTEFAETLYQQICGFGEYGFPESHSASFAVLAYCSAWLKCYYPEAFYTALLNSLPMGFYSPSQLIQDAQRHDIHIEPVCINHSHYDHTVVTSQTLSASRYSIRLGLRQVKGLSEHGAQRLVKARPDNGYQTMSQVKRLQLTRRDMEALASANAMAMIAEHRYATRWDMMDTLNDLPLFEHLSERLPQAHRAPSCAEDLIEDYAATGLSLAHHPITLLDQAGQLPRFTRHRDLSQQPDGSMITVAGVVTGRQAPGTATGITFVTLEDDTGNTNVVIWQATARAQKQTFLNAKLMLVKGILEKEGEVTHVIAGKLVDLTPHLATLTAPSRDFH
ncbi:error-prone DNA polymerase [Vibrio palustris]|uniref:Error-prone DNA polymerase n=1 Tax=Vibrio palustris TaxID=1918946 RepID=A0A1R4B0R9_9VIBR|nr:error-prone DNA polymerase [Vibrio palustris]SJL82504.1 Error-prone DNA polymerase [Vibrio palustris]